MGNKAEFIDILPPKPSAIFPSRPAYATHHSGSTPNIHQAKLQYGGDGQWAEADT
jgi:hypothetical protein